MRQRPRPRTARLAALAVLVACALAMTGCTEVQEKLTFDSKGGGSYVLVVRRDADLWQRIGGVLGKDVLAKIEGRPFPTSVRAWTEATKGVAGVKPGAITETDAGKGWRELRVELEFRSLKDLLKVEPLARRSMRVTNKPVSPGSKSRICTLEMAPITALPVLDPLAALFNAVDAPPAQAESRASPRDQTALRRLGVDKGEASMVRRLLEPSLGKVRLAFRVEVPGEVVSVGGERTSAGEEFAEQAFDFKALRDPKTDRRVRLSWRVRELDTPPAADHRGDRRDAAVRQIPK